MANPARRNEWLNRNRLNIIMYTLVVIFVLFVYLCISDDFSFTLTLGEILQMFGFCFLVAKILKEKSCSGVSLKSLQLYALVYFSRTCSIMFQDGYLPYDSSGDYVYRLVELASLIIVISLVVMGTFFYNDTYNAREDGFGGYFGLPSQYGGAILAVPAFLLAIILHPSLNSGYFSNILWTFALYLETLAILPQIHLLQKANKAVEAWVSHFVFSVGLSRVLLAIFWLTSYHELTNSSSIGITGGWVGRMVLFCQIVHIGLMADFCYYYIKASVQQSPLVLPGLQV